MTQLHAFTLSVWLDRTSEPHAPRWTVSLNSVYQNGRVAESRIIATFPRHRRADAIEHAHAIGRDWCLEVIDSSPALKLWRA